MLAGALQAGEIKLHTWPCQFVAQNFMTVDVKMDIGYWIQVANQGNYTITMSQTDIHTYDGCVTIPVNCNFNATLAVSISAYTANTGGSSIGTFSATITPTQITMGTTNVVVCAHLTGANLKLVAGGTNGVKVAVVQITVVPTT